MSAPVDVANFLTVVEGMLGSSRRTERLVAELEDHLLTAIEHAQARGDDPGAAARTAILKLGTPEQIVEAVQRQRRLRGSGVPAALIGLAACGCAALLTHGLMQEGDGWSVARVGLGAITLAQGALALWGFASQPAR